MASTVLQDPGKALERIDEVCERVDEMKGVTEPTAELGKAQRVDSAYGSESLTPTELLNDVEGSKEDRYTWPVMLQHFKDQINEELMESNAKLKKTNDGLKQKNEDLTKENKMLERNKSVSEK